MERAKKEPLSIMSLRKRAGLSQRQVAQAIDVQTATVGRWEQGSVSPRLTPSQTKKLLEVFNCSLDDLIEAFEGAKISSTST
ncbi:putative transcriptional regulator [Rivularia sp. PCC 7116]|uniref:helix-turn-helix transcriptional regulator n=1 Tax=Rivularia sp. PCC 7116 TaxID=373994 RepID=UPI00029F2450|nr:putative transcriptional regulator [Rivularia sp. PCC 7116]